MSRSAEQARGDLMNVRPESPGHPSPGRVVATLHPDALDDAMGSFHGSPAVDSHVYDEWTAEAEAEALDRLGSRPSLDEELTLEPPPEPDAPKSVSAAWWLLLGSAGLGALAMLGAAALALGAASVLFAFTM